MKAIITTCKLALAIICIIVATETKASHIVGGELTYRFLSYNTDRTAISYEVTMNLYRDPDGIDFPLTVDLGIFIEDDLGIWTSYKVAEDIPISKLDLISPDCCGCHAPNLYLCTPPYDELVFNA